MLIITSTISIVIVVVINLVISIVISVIISVIISIVISVVISFNISIVISVIRGTPGAEQVLEKELPAHQKICFSLYSSYLFCNQCACKMFI